MSEDLREGKRARKLYTETMKGMLQTLIPEGSLEVITKKVLKNLLEFFESADNLGID